MTRFSSKVSCGPCFIWGAALLVLATLVGCTIKDVQIRHIVMADANGHPLDPTGNIGCDPEPRLCQGKHLPIWLFKYRNLTTSVQPDAKGQAFEEYLNELFKGMDEYFDKEKPACKARARKDGARDGVPHRRVLVFIHGGLNEQKQAINRASRLAELIKEDCDYYPIFINWDSSFFSSYYDHVLHLRQGGYIEWWKPAGLPMAPFYLAADLVRGVVQAPMVWASELGKLEIEEGLQDELGLDITIPWGPTIENDYKRVSCELRQDAGLPPKDYCKRFPPKAGYVSSPPQQAIRIGEGDDHRKFFPEQFFSGIGWLATLPTKIIAAPLVDSLGASAWDTMLRRTHVLFQADEEFVEQAGGPYKPPSGAAAVFLRRLAREIGDKKDDWDITLVGHSMGTIIANEMLRDFPELPYRNILYVGAASTVRDYEDSAFPYLKNNLKANVYHLTLLEAAEERERLELRVPFTDWAVPYVDPAMRGSLLIWLDDFLASPMTYLDRTLGSYANLMLAAHDTPNDIRGRVHIKAFSAGADVSAPQTHGELVSKLYFWREHCWKATDQIQPDCFNAEGHGN